MAHMVSVRTAPPIRWRNREGWALVDGKRGQVFRVFWGRFIAREEAKAYRGARVIRVNVVWIEPPPKLRKKQGA